MNRRFSFIFFTCFLAACLATFFFFQKRGNQPSFLTDRQKSTKGESRTHDALSKDFPVVRQNDQPNKSLQAQETMAWIYPGEPSCAAKTEYSDGRAIDIIKPEYFSVNESGDLTELLESERGCNGYSAENVSDLKKYSKEQFITVSSSYSKSMDIFLVRALQGDADVNRLAKFAIDNDVTGIELDFEDFGGWSGGTYGRYKEFVQKLGKTLHEKEKKLMIDGPAIPNSEEAAWYPWRYEDFVSLPVDRVVIMAYDYQFDHGAGSPIAPLDWMEQVLKWTVSKFPDISRLSVGVPSYGYRGAIGSNQITLLTYDQIKDMPGFGTAKRDELSGEMTWTDFGVAYFFQDEESMNRKRAIAEKFGIPSVSVWHLGGNKWFRSK